MNQRFLGGLFLFIIVIVATCTCKRDATKWGNSEFESFKERFITDLWQQYPTWASYTGYYKHVDSLSIPNDARRQNNVAFSKRYLDTLNGIDLEGLNLNNQTDLLMIKNELEKKIWQTETFKSHEWKPSNYNVGGSFNLILISDYAKLDDRLRSFYAKMAHVPAYYEAAKANIKKPTEIHTKLAVSQNKGALSVFGAKLLDSLAISGLSAKEKIVFKDRIQNCKVAIKDYIAFNMSRVNNGSENGSIDNAFKDFRIGKELFSQKFDYDIVSSNSAEEIYNKALAHKKKLHTDMIKISHDLWSKYMKKQKKPEKELVMVKMLIDEIAKKHVKRENFVEEIRNQLPTLAAFIKEKKLLTLDDSKPLEVRETPEYMRGIAGASISAPGPYDKDAPTYYNVTPLDHYSKEEAESYLREYNHYILQILNIHEALPGHYAQLVYANQSPSLIKSIFGNGAMIEGWAVYSEIMMLEEGYGDNAPEMWLMYNKWSLRVTCNTIIDYGIHALDFPEEKVMDILVNEAFQESAEAKGKWKRARASQVQLCSYFTGYREIYEFREELKKKEGEKFDLKSFHEKILSFGSAPVKYLKTLY